MSTRSSSGGLAVRVAVALLLLISLAGVAISIDAHSATADASHSAKADAQTHSATADAQTTGAQIAAKAASQAGVAYCDSGGGYNGPTLQTNGSACSKPGYSCMSLAMYAVYQVTGNKIPQPDANDTYPNGYAGTWIKPQSTEAQDVASLDPGDAVFFGGAMNNYAHTGIYAGSSEVWDAGTSTSANPTGEVAQTAFSQLVTVYGLADYQGAMRYGTGSSPPLSVTTTSLPPATIGEKYVGAQLSASGGTTPYRWKVSGLPKGLKASAKSGLIKGKVTSSKRHPQAAGSYSVKVTATDSANDQASATLTLKLDAAS